MFSTLDCRAAVFERGTFAWRFFLTLLSACCCVEKTHIQQWTFTYVYICICMYIICILYIYIYMCKFS